MKIYFIHVPKCGGGSLDKTLSKQFNNNYIHIHDDGKKPLRINKNSKDIVITLIRDPIHRWLSCYRYVTQRDKWKRYADDVRNITGGLININDVLDWIRSQDDFTRAFESVCGVHDLLNSRYTQYFKYLDEWQSRLVFVDDITSKGSQKIKYDLECKLGVEIGDIPWLHKTNSQESYISSLNYEFLKGLFYDEYKLYKKLQCIQNNLNCKTL